MRFKDFMEFGLSTPPTTARQPHMYLHKANTPTRLAMHQQYPTALAQSANDVLWKGTDYNDELANWTSQISSHLENMVSDGQTTFYNGKNIIAKEYIDTNNKEIIRKSGGKITSEYAIAALLKNGAIKPLNVPVHKVDEEGYEAIAKAVEDQKDLTLKTGSISLNDCNTILKYMQYLNGETSKNIFNMYISEKGLLPNVPNKLVLESGSRMYIPDEFLKQSAPQDAINYMTTIGLLQQTNLPCYEINMQRLKVMQLHRKAIGSYRDLSNDIFNRMGQTTYQNQFIK